MTNSYSSTPFCLFDTLHILLHFVYMFICLCSKYFDISVYKYVDIMISFNWSLYACVNACYTTVGIYCRSLILDFDLIFVNYFIFEKQN